MLLKPLIYSEKWAYLSNTERAVMLGIFLVSKNGKYYGGYELLSQFTGFHEKSLSKIFKRLVNKNLISLLAKRPGRTDLYEVILENSNDLFDTYELKVEAKEAKEKVKKIKNVSKNLPTTDPREILLGLQFVEIGIGCIGCGRELESEFMELDHIMPKSDGGSDSISNRIFICTPCNRKKLNGLTISGLRVKNKQDGWMEDETLALKVYEKVRKYINITNE